MAKLPRPSWLPRAIRWTGITVAVLLVLALISWLAVPPVAKHLVEQQVEAQIGRKASVGKIAFNPLNLTLTASDFTLYEPDKTTPAFSASTLLVNASFASLFRLAPVLDEAQLINPKLHIVRTSADGIGRYNFSDVIDRILAMPKSDKPAQFSVSNIQLQNGAIKFDDKVTGKLVDIEALNIGLPYISNFASKVDTFVQPHISAKINGTPFDLKGRSKPFAGSLETSLAIDIDQLDVASYVAFSPVALPLAIQSAKLSTKLDLTFIRNKDKPEVVLSGGVQLADLALADKNAAPLLKAQSVSAQIGKLNVLTGAAALDQIEIQKPEVWVNLNANGSLNWAALSTPAAKQEIVKDAPKKPATAQAPMTLAKLSIRDGIVNWKDAANASPALDLQVKNVTLDASRLSTAANAKPATVTLSTGSETDQHIQFIGQITPAKAMVAGKASIKALSLAPYQPYVNRSLAAVVSGQLSLETLLAIEDGRIQLHQLGIDVDDLKVAAKNNAGGSVAAKKISLENASLDTQAHTFNAAALRLAGIQGDVRRDAQGKLNLQQFIAPAGAAGKSAPTAPAKPSGPEWVANLSQFALTDSSVSYLDNAVKPAVKLRADGLNLSAENISSKLDKPIKVALRTQINKSGKLAVDGSVAAQMKSVALDIDAQNLPVPALQPYFTDFLNVTLSSGLASTKGKLSLVLPSGRQQMVTGYNGNLRLANFRVLDKETSADFLKWKMLDVSGINANIGGPRQNVTLAKIALSDFYARIILSETAKLNLQDIVVSKNAPPGAPAPSLTSAEAGEGMGQGTPKVTQPTATGTITVAPIAVAPPKENAPVIKIGQVVIKGGNINYTDNFVKPNYTANMTGMNGTVGAIASDKPAPAPIDLNGKIDNDAPVAISGSLNPLFKPMFLDIKASANGVELPRLTPYAAKYAGYAIEKGKLSMDVSYHIENDKLVADNNVRIDQLTFGDKIDSPTATKLPVLLAVALLKDRNGQININLPISGTLSDPQFSIGGIIVRIFINLIVKAVTSPFALISSAFGGSGGDELGYAEFAPGSATLSAATQGKLDTIAKALNDRPALKLDLIGRVDPKTDTDGVRQQVLNRQLKQLKQKDSVDQSEDTQSDDVTLTDADKDKYMGKVYSAGKFDKPRNAIGFAKSLPTAEMEKLIVANTPVTQDALSALATRRAEAVRKYLETKGKIPLERIFLIAPKLTADGIKDKGAPNRVDFALK
ncbi:DUF748 domain-containing protein [Collimonas pratensis]|uniref:DUF748 domain-containing protein n=1 Tax=Collimonas pratensis TaxID=279113 RepID=UPI00143D9E51|nr:DUF748 domain-containing protein [Collimonas pratensis]NKI72678.1 DUF748 domain-containing protein [Collimonas pratensis]